MDTAPTGEVIVRLDSASKTLALVCAVLFTGAGVAMIVVSIAGLVEQTGSQQIVGLVLGVLAIGFAVVVGMALRRPPDTVKVDENGFFLRKHPDVEFGVAWPDLAGARLYRERCHVGHIRVWFYRLEWEAADGEFGRRHPEMDEFHNGDRYSYALGRLGWDGKRLYDGFRQHGPQTVRYQW
ncbi:hypothetical protein CFN78_06400 [Amycolatopsis antarctica]|uniref:Uncharacterized protein n=1 Tax=Amycolatopsis antarctica TaxID=1854586 RepID=A0A263D7C0_9PSEU|nr:hypothetical protein [Amycolatopsis antarctica]OZM73918.1 hypothetical protein CFN78_06400 [Amycolatopsis antarctica]